MYIVYNMQTLGRQMFCSDCQFMINVEIRKLNMQTKKVMSDENLVMMNL